MSGRVRPAPPYPFNGSVSFAHNKDQARQVNGFKEMATGGLFGEWAQKDQAGGTIALQPTTEKEKRLFSWYDHCLLSL